MKYGNKEVISDSEAKRFARNLCKRERFPSFDEALDFVFRIRKVVSDTESRMQREHCRLLAWQMRDAPGDDREEVRS